MNLLRDILLIATQNKLELDLYNCYLNLLIDCYSNTFCTQINENLLGSDFILNMIEN